jgi:hypothetical protein
MFVGVTVAKYCVCDPFYIQMHPSTPLRVKNKESFMPSGDEASVYVLRILTHRGALFEGPERRKSRWPR